MSGHSGATVASVATVVKIALGRLDAVELLFSYCRAVVELL